MDSSPNTSPIAVFCKELREARRYRQISLVDVAEATRISSDYLDAIESGRWDDVPRAYLRGYLVLYASAVGMNREKVLRSFDRLVSPASASASVEFDDAPRELRQPQDMGVTRAKIRVSWFAQLSRNRKAIYLLTAIVLIFYLAVLRLSRKPQESAVAMNTFAETLTEYRESSHGPFTTIPLESDTLPGNVTSFKAPRAMIVGIQNAVVTVNRNTERGIRLRLAVFDTVVVPFTSELSITAKPSGSVRVHEDSAAVDPERSIAGGDVYFLQAGRAVAHRAVRSEKDSL